MAAHFSLLSCLLFSLFTISLSATSFRCHPSDYKALLQIKKDLGNPYLLASWTPNDPDCCGWYCLKCDEITNRVDTLLIDRDDVLSSTIPNSVGDLPYLKSLVFRKLSNLHGTIPAAIAKLKRLTFVRLSWSKLSGPVPDFFSQLPNMEYLDLSYNQLTGTIPPSFSKLSKLQALHLDRNNLTGTIPESFGNFATAPDLYLSHNHLTGTVPKSFAKLTFVRIDLSRNKLEGDASFLFKSDTTEILDISRNMFEFDFSKVKIPAKRVNTLDINHNKIYGSIPKEIGNTVFLNFFNVSYNRLCGKIPTNGRFKQYEESMYIHNKCLCGKPLSVKC